MITLKEASRIAKEQLEDSDTFVVGVCDDIGDSWVFDWAYRDDPEGSVLDKGLLQVDKESGESRIVGLGLPGDELFNRLYKNKNKLDIRAYL